MDRFQYNLAGMFLWWPSTKIVQAVMIHQKSWPLGGGAYFPYIENFKNFLVRNSWIEFNVTWQECCFGDLLPRLFKPSWYVKNHGPQGGGAYLIFHLYLHRKILKFFLSHIPWLISILLGWNVALVNLYQDCTSNHDSSKNMAAMGWGLFSLYI